ncbi:MAG: hypothetical protein ABI782_02140 [Anaerolineaceae bacterium]
MILPKQRSVYANLNTSFTSYSELLADQQEHGLSGFLRLSFPGYQGVLFLVAGKPVNALEEFGGERIVGDAAAAAIVERATAKNGMLDVDAAPGEVVELLARVLDARPLYKDLTSSFTSLERLFTKLQQDALTGYVEIILFDDAGTAMVLFQNGEPVESVFSSPSGTLTGFEARSAVVRSVGAIGGTFNVYRVPGQLDSAPPTPETLVRPIADSSPLLAFWSEVCARIEAVAESLGGASKFRSALREVLVSRANTYPFLDPFAAEFEYKDGAILFEGPLPAEFSKALGACLGDTVAKLAFQLKRADFEERVRASLADVSAKHAAVIERWSLGEDVREFVA